ncbi:hypothetical protein AB2L28_16440 [Kineococcus sp. TBRC 1896]|uniref:Uncharacterized protein n=1 Tax=Kineococcus mangrovi TaxID=1660183 RepID=A0ABV4I7W7_9ACTN
MLSRSDLPGRLVHVVAPRRVDASWPDPTDRARAVVATLDVLRPVTTSLVVDLAADRWVEDDSSLLPVDLHPQQRWAEHDLRELPAPTRTGRWPGAVWIDAGDDALWVTARTYATASLGVRVLDAAENTLAEVDDGGTVITAALTAAEADLLRGRRPDVTVTPLDGLTRRRLQRGLDAEDDRRERGRPGWFDSHVAYLAHRRRDRENPWEPAPPEPHPADAFTVDLSVTTEVRRGREPALVVARFGVGGDGRPRTTAHLDRIRAGVFAVHLDAISAGSFPDGGHRVACRVLSPSRRVTGNAASLLVDRTEGDLVDPGARPPLHDGWGMWMPWDGWSVYVERAAEDELTFSAPVEWTGTVRARSAPPDPARADGTATVTLRLSRR